MKKIPLLVLLTSVAAATEDQLLYQPATLVPLATDFTGTVAAGDLNGDGFGDFVFASDLSGSPIQVGLGDGEGSFSVSVLPSGRIAPFELIDFDGDATLDLVHGSTAPQSLALSRGLADGTFAEPVIVVDLSTGPTGISHLDTGDVNSDGHLDLSVGTGAFAVAHRVFLAAGDGTFTESLSSLPVTVFGTSSLGDLNGDGLDDVVTSSLLGKTWSRSNGDGTFADVLTLPTGGGVPIIEDMLGGSADEVMISEPNGLLRDIVVFIVDGDQALEVARVTTPFAAYGGPFQVSAEDVDGDGLRDIITIAGLLGHVFRQMPDETFELAASFTTPENLSSAATVMDVEGDGGGDLIFPSSNVGLFLARDATYAADAPFVDLGGASPGAAGFPAQTLESSDTALTVRVTSTRPSSPIFAIWGASAGMPFANSTISPTPDRILGPVMTSPDGTLTATATNALPLGLEIYAQWWIVDAFAPSGLASTSTVKIAQR